MSKGWHILLIAMYACRGQRIAQLLLIYRQSSKGYGLHAACPRSAISNWLQAQLTCLRVDCQMCIQQLLP